MSELLNALNPAAARKRTRDEYEYTSGMFDAYLQPILVRPAVPTHRSELEYAMMDTTKLQARYPHMLSTSPITEYTGLSPNWTPVDPVPDTAISEMPSSIPSPDLITPTATPVPAVDTLGPPTSSVAQSVEDQGMLSDVPSSLSSLSASPPPDEEPSPPAKGPKGRKPRPGRPKFQVWAPMDGADQSSFAQEPLAEVPSSEESEAEIAFIDTNEPTSRKHGKDRRVITIQTAMRKQAYRSMGTSPDQPLPEAYNKEDGPVKLSEPVRFEWSKTMGQSPHNQTMRTRIIDELRKRRAHFPHVPTHDFEDTAALEGVFDASYHTMRNKWRAQQAAAGLPTKAGPAVTKAHSKPAAAAPTKPVSAVQTTSAAGTRSRQHARKKARQKERAQCRRTMDEFTHETFDKALLIGCISSDESEEAETDAFTAATAAKPVLVSHPPPWRSKRLERFYALLDEASALRPESTANRPRGVERRARKRGPAKTGTGRQVHGLVLPPKGVATWMISKHWRRKATETLKHTRKLLPQLIQEDQASNFDWDEFDLLGSESEEDAGASRKTTGTAAIEESNENNDALA